MVDHTKFQEFDAVMHLYVNYKHSQKAEALTNQARNISAFQGRGGGRQCRGGHGRGGQGGPGDGLSGGVPQEEVEKVWTLEAWYYSPHGGQDDSILSAKLFRIAPETSSF